MNNTQLYLSYLDKSGEQHNGTNTLVAHALMHVIHEHILTATTSFVLTLCCRNAHTCNFYANLLEQLFRVWGTVAMQLVVLAENSTQRVPGARHYNLIMTDSYEAFTEIDIAAYTQHNNYNEYYYIFLQTRDQLVHAEMQRIFEYCWTHYLINCNVQVQSARGEIFVYSYFPFTAQHCGRVVPVRINQFIGSGFVREELFPRKLLNFYGCALKVAAWDVPPFLYLHTDAAGKSHIVSGFEGNMLRELAKKLNFTIDIRVPPNDEQRGRYENNVWSGAMGMLHQRQADLSLGCFRQTTIRDTNASAIGNYYQSAEVVSIPIAAYRFTSMEILLYPFQTHTWLLILTVCGVSWLKLALLRRQRQRRATPFIPHSTTHSPWNVLLVLVGMPITTTHCRQHYARVFWATWLVYALILRGIYQALLFYFIRTQMSKRMPQDFDELVARNYTVIMNRNTYDTLSTVHFLQQLRRRSLNTSLEMVAFDYIATVPRRDIAAIGPLDFLLHYVRCTGKGHALTRLPQDVLNLQVTMYFTKHSYLLDEFQEQLVWMCAAGLIDFWVRSELNYEYFKTLRRARDTILGLEELNCMFYIIGFGLLIASFVFLLELWSKRNAVLLKLFTRIQAD